MQSVEIGAVTQARASGDYSENASGELNYACVDACCI